MGTRSVFFGHHLDSEGEPVAGAAVYVRNQHADESTIDDLIAATIYLEDSDHPTLSASTQANPITTAADGSYAIWLAEPAKVDLKIVTPGGLLQNVNRTVVVNRVPNDGPSMVTYAETIGDGVATSFAVAHGLGSKDVNVDVYKVSTGATVEPDIVRTDNDTVTVSFLTAPSSNEYRVTVVGSALGHSRVMCGKTNTQSFPTSGANNDMTFDRIKGAAGLLVASKKFTANEDGTWGLRVWGEWEIPSGESMTVHIYKNGVDGGGTPLGWVETPGYTAVQSGIPFQIEVFDDLVASDYLTVFCYPLVSARSLYKYSSHSFVTLVADFYKVA